MLIRRIDTNGRVSVVRGGIEGCESQSTRSREIVSQSVIRGIQIIPTKTNEIVRSVNEIGRDGHGNGVGRIDIGTIVRRRKSGRGVAGWNQRKNIAGQAINRIRNRESGRRGSQNVIRIGGGAIEINGPAISDIEREDRRNEGRIGRRGRTIIRGRHEGRIIENIDADILKIRAVSAREIAAGSAFGKSGAALEGVIADFAEITIEGNRFEGGVVAETIVIDEIEVCGASETR